MSDLGLTFGRWTCIGIAAPRYAGQQYLIVRCACGAEREVSRNSLRQGKSLSCGDCSGKKAKRSKLSATRSDRARWHAMISRCHRQEYKVFQNYGGRGIRVCDRWRFGEGDHDGFACFMLDVGPQPFPGAEIDRINNDGNYEPANVRWVTRSEQMSNTRRTRLLNLAGHKVTLTDAARAAGLSASCLHRRLAAGMELLEALEKSPIHQKKGECA